VRARVQGQRKMRPKACPRGWVQAPENARGAVQSDRKGARMSTPELSFVRAIEAGATHQQLTTKLKQDLALTSC